MNEALAKLLDRTCGTGILPVSHGRNAHAKRRFARASNVRLPKLPVLSVLGLLMCLPVAGADALMETAQQEAAVVLEKGRSSGPVSTVFDVEPLGRYRLTMRAKVTGQMTVETNPEFREIFYDTARGQRGADLPGWRKHFATPGGERGDMHIFFPYWYVFVSSGWREYVDEFYVPIGCNRLTVTYSRSGATRLEAGAPRLEKVTGETVNINPHFSFGEFGLAGYAHAGFGAGVRLLPRPEGEGFFLRVLTWINTDPVPVTPGVRYRVRLVLRKDTVRNRWGKVLFMDAAFKDVPHSGGIVLAKPGPEGGEDSFVAPPGAAYVMLRPGSGDYSDIEIIPVKGDVK